MEIEKLLIVGVGLYLIYLICTGKFNLFKPQKVESFCPGNRNGYSQDDAQKINLHQKITGKFPCYQNYKGLGYDNPYIFPYNYNWKQNNPLDPMLKYPGWVRELYKDVSDQNNQFPGYNI